MLNNDGLVKEMGRDKTTLLEAALKHEAEAARCPSLSEVAGFSEEEQRIGSEKSLLIWGLPVIALFHSLECPRFTSYFLKKKL